MSLHQYLVPPPLALAIHPAPPYKSSSADKDKTKDKDKDNDKKGDEKPKAAEGEGKEVKQDKADAENKRADHGVVKGGAALPPDAVAEQEDSPTADHGAGPASPGSMVPEPATPASGVLPAEAEVPHPEEIKAVEAKPVAHDDKAKPDDSAHKDANAKGEDKDKKSKDDSASKPDDKPEPEPEPLCLVGPCPKLPIRTKLDLDPSKPWPPIETDPRGAYHHYAKGVYRGLKESLRIDVTKDGWMSEQWREKSERDALARLRGEDIKKAQRELEAEARRREVKKVPKKAGEVLLLLWNALVEAPNNEVSIEDFWSTLDWEEEGAGVHSTTLSSEQKNGNKPVVIDGQEVEWTKEGVEEILATVGVQCAYNSDKPIGRRYTERYPGGVFAQDRAFLLLAHGHFMLRLKEWLEFKPQDSAGKFEVLVTSGHDRVFGEMVRAQRMERKKEEEMEYIKKKRAQREKEKREGKEGEAEGRKDDEKEKEGGDVKKSDGKEKEGDVEKDDKKEKEEEKAKSDTSTKKVKDGIEINHDKEKKDPGEVNPDQDVKVLVAIPVPAPGPDQVQNKDKDNAAAEELDAKHDQEAIVAAPGEAAAAAEANAEKEGKEERKDGEDEKEKPARDPLRDAEKLAKMMAKPGDLRMQDIQVALKVLEAAAGDSKTKPDSKDKDKDKEEPALIWTWGETCEKWRWKNYEAGVHNVGLGGWEERDWKVFADDRGVAEFEKDMEREEVEEEDIHDWSC